MAGGEEWLLSVSLLQFHWLNWLAAVSGCQNLNSGKNPAQDPSVCKCAQDARQTLSIQMFLAAKDLKLPSQDR